MVIRVFPKLMDNSLGIKGLRFSEPQKSWQFKLMIRVFPCDRYPWLRWTEVDQGDLSAGHLYRHAGGGRKGYPVDPSVFRPSHGVAASRL
jgi:hypothetical protein